MGRGKGAVHEDDHSLSDKDPAQPSFLGSPHPDIPAGDESRRLRDGAGEIIFRDNGRSHRLWRSGGLCLCGQRQSHRGIHDPAWILCGRHKRGVQIYEKALPLRYADGLRDKILDPGCGDRADGVRSGGVPETEMKTNTWTMEFSAPN